LGWQSAEGTWHRHRKVFGKRREADAHAARTRLEMAHGTFGVKVKRAPTVADVAPRFLEWSEQHNKPSSVAAKDVALRVHLLPALGHLRLDAVELRAEVGALTEKMLGEGLSPKTVNNTVAVLRKLLNLAAEDWGHIQQAPKLMKKLRHHQPKADFLDVEEANRLLAAAEPAWRTFLLVALRTGLRVGELLGLQWKDVDSKLGQLLVRRTRWRGQELLPKNGRERVVPLTRDALAALIAHRHLRGPHVFCHEDGKPFAHWEVEEVVPDACKAAGVKRLTNHGLRHTFASNLVQQGVHLVVGKDLLGLQSLGMVLRYAHLAESATRDAVQLLDSGSR